MSGLAQLDPQVLWRHFDNLLQVPRPSRHEEGAKALVRSWARARSLAMRQDSYGNLVIAVPARPGFESAPGVVLQAHLDMVCEHSPEIHIDFNRSGIEAFLDGEWVRASGTTLGADNGIGVAAALAIADDQEIVHGPLEILLTVEEEIGLKGAMQMDESLVGGRILVNLDSEDTAFYIGSAGATDIEGHFRFQPISASDSGRTGRLMVSGLRGGHSGLSVHANPLNAIKLLADILETMRQGGLLFKIVEINGGSNRNAIPRSAFATLWIRSENAEALEPTLARVEYELKSEFRGLESGLRIAWQDMGDKYPARLLSQGDTDRLISLLTGIPQGVLGLSSVVEGLVESSNNLAVVTTEETEVILKILTRSSSGFALKALSRQIEAVLSLAGATAEARHSYPAWKPDLSSELLALAGRVFERLFGERPSVKAVHAGLECGVIGRKVPGMEAISIGPLILGAHTPEERVHVASVAKFYRFLGCLLAEIAHGRERLNEQAS